ncbi:adenine phosphoribosyltransferase [Candidatus Poribacteria bacterium]|nr:adenine phosphoribosyltransferase [Candidatus Poribacteria bacterium]
MDLKKYIRDIPDFPKKGIIFKDITTLLMNGKAFEYVIDQLANHYKNKKIDLIVGVESRGFIFGATLAYKMGIGFIPIRKPGKLPYKTIKATYSLEYGTDSIEIHEDAIKKAQHVLVVDDLLATGGTAGAMVDLVKKLGGEIAGVTFVIELTFLNGKDKLKGQDIFSLIKY